MHVLDPGVQFVVRWHGRVGLSQRLAGPGGANLILVVVRVCTTQEFFARALLQGLCKVAVPIAHHRERALPVHCDIGLLVSLLVLRTWLVLRRILIKVPEAKTGFWSI